MMLGEIEYDELFGNDCGEGPCPKVLFPGTSHVLVGCFILMISMVLMNVLFGMAVADIQVNIQTNLTSHKVAGNRDYCNLDWKVNIFFCKSESY